MLLYDCNTDELTHAQLADKPKDAQFNVPAAEDSDGLTDDSQVRGVADLDRLVVGPICQEILYLYLDIKNG